MKRFILAHDIRDFSPWLTGSVDFGQNVTAGEDVVEQTCPSHGARKQKRRNDRGKIQFPRRHFLGPISRKTHSTSFHLYSFYDLLVKTSIHLAMNSSMNYSIDDVRVFMIPSFPKSPTSEHSCTGV